jgi:hypothetical protein
MRLIELSQGKFAKVDEAAAFNAYSLKSKEIHGEFSCLK